MDQRYRVSPWKPLRDLFMRLEATQRPCEPLEATQTLRFQAERLQNWFVARGSVECDPIRTPCAPAAALKPISEL
eukprot:4287884-Pyramimonas_sp.AAC.1